ncbi:MULTISPECIES: hypothetical protein [unclassified Streptomyces]|uniref:hypothetical protein n=1 Tax=unclassified Streptomyces TaxID=2593676 RepID=UPI002DD7F9A5|nr:hypothetical protein [Streptomyces sp. NBC_01445]WSE09934.1 hypothetical protein OG574_45295 [Streptomyces sp. NBC_01445]
MATEAVTASEHLKSLITSAASALWEDNEAVGTFLDLVSWMSTRNGGSASALQFTHRRDGSRHHPTWARHRHRP